MLTKVEYILLHKENPNKFKGIKIIHMMLSGHNKVKLEINEYVKINKRIYFHYYMFIYIHTHTHTHTHTQYSSTFRNFKIYY